MGAFDTVRAVNRAQYNGFDFNSIFDSVLADLQTRYKDQFNNFSTNAAGTYLLDLVSNAVDQLSFYQDRRATDSYITLARTRKAISLLARFLGYKIRGAVASSTTVTLALTATLPVGTTIATGRQFRGPSTIIYEAARDVPISTSDLSVQIPVYEGTTRVETFSALGVPNETISLSVPDGRFLLQGTPVVKVNGTQWEEVDFLRFETTDTYEVDYFADPPQILFGNGSAGNIPAATATIEVSYVAGLGRGGQVISDTIDALVDPLVVMGQPIATTISNALASSGGDDPESIEETRRNAPTRFKARGVAVTRPDYEGHGSSFSDPLAGRVAVAQAFSPRSANADSTLKSVIQDIKDQFTSLPTDVAAQIAMIRTELAAIQTREADLATALSALVAQALSAATDVATLTTLNTTDRRTVQGLASDAMDLLTQVATAKATITAISIGTSDTLTATTRDTLLGQLSRANSLATGMNTGATTVASDLATAGTTLLGLTETLTSPTVGIGTDTSTGYAGQINNALVDITARVGVPTPATGLYATVGVIESLVVTQGTSRLTEVSTDLQALYDHVDRILAADCKVNLVEVPIFARDAGGFYAEPSVGLQQALQAFLEVRKEVTQTVAVVSGANALVRPVLVLRVGVLDGFSLDLTAQAVRAVTEDLLRNRRFGDSLYISDLTDVILPIEGVAFVNVTIVGYRTTQGTFTDKNDTSGNLIIQKNEIITRDSTADGSITITTEVFRRTG